MRRFPLLPILLAVPLVALAQAVAPLPPPMSEPVEVEPPPPTSYTPAGAGLPGERVPGKPVEVPRSPNKRVLPATKEPGLWAADGAPVAIARRHLWGIVVPLPDGESADVVEYDAWHCSMAVEDAAIGARVASVISGFHDDVRRCAVAIAQHHCAATEVDHAERRRARGEEVDPDGDARRALVEAYFAKLKASWCSGIVLTPEQQKALSSALRFFDEAARKAAMQ